MARPISITTVLKGEAAKKLFEEAEKRIMLSAEKKKQLEKYAALYRKFVSTKRELHPA